MIRGAAFRLVLLVSCAHALVHVYELAWPSVEQEVAAQYFADDEAAGKRLTGVVSNFWRLAWGLGALLAGWLVDRYGGRPMLAIYLLGCGAACAVVGGMVELPVLIPTMLVMGAFASIYHPAGLALISHATTPENRPAALGMHGIFGSLGIGAAPLLAWLLLSSGMNWTSFYWALAVLGGLLGLVFVVDLWRRNRNDPNRANDDRDDMPQIPLQEPPPRWKSYFTLTVLAAMQGFVYSALMSFLPRYLSGGSLGLDQGDAIPWSKFWAAVVLWIGCGGQYLAGRFAAPRLLERQLYLVTFANAPALVWMALAGGWQRTLAAALFSLVHFMHQPLYNTLIAKYTPARRRSLCYGFSFAMAFGLGSFGALFAGLHTDPQIIYTRLALVAACAGVVGVLLGMQNRGDRPT